MRVVIATSNSGKYRELLSLLTPLTCTTPSLTAVPLPPGYRQAPENRTTFVENALQKARRAAAQCGMPAISDDSGLVVPALDGAPGIYSARYAGKHRNPLSNINKLVAAVRPLSPAKRLAYYVCVLVFTQSDRDPAPIVASGTLHGTISLTPKGAAGFGYDPIFYLPSYGKTVAELTEKRKNKISHRSVAASLFLPELKKVVLSSRRKR